MHPIIRLVNRNLTISLNKGFLIWQVVFPLIYIFVAGFAYTALIHEVPFANKRLDYPAFIASGMIGFNIMNSTRSEEHTSELQSRFDLVCRLLLEKKKIKLS